jgi:hypothetical protein
MRVLFLDFDGCVHPACLLATQSHDALTRSLGPFDYTVPVDLFAWLPLLIEMLAPHPDVFIVVHSSWRETYPAAEIGDMLGDLGRRYLGVTPPGPKWESLTTWLARNTATSWRILDDAPREFPDPPPLELIVCHPLAGLSAPEVQAQLTDWLETS